MAKKVRHHESSQCPVACTLDIIGDHWTLLVVREMMFMGHHQYKDMLAMPEGISSNILSDRLKKLETRGMVSSARKPDNKRDKLYYLTEKGKGLVHVMIEISRWASLNLGGRVHIPGDRRPLLDNPPEVAARMVFRQLEEWEQKNLG